VIISEMIKQKKFIVTSELAPPKGPVYEKALSAAEKMTPFVDAINVTDGQGAVMRMGSLPLCHLLLERGIEPIFQLTCRDRNRIALQSEVLNASGFGIKNILCLTGDYVSFGDHPEAKPVFDLDSVSLLSATKKLNGGFDLGGNILNGSTKLCVGAVVNPNALPLEPQLLKMKRKILAGASFFQTQAVFDVSKLEPFVQLSQEMKVPLIMGVLLLKNPQMARFVNENVSGIDVPESLICELEEANEAIEAGIEIAGRIIKKARNVCQGVHIMPGGREELVQKILGKAGIL